MTECILSSEDLTDEKIWCVKLVYLSGLVETKIEARRLISQGAVSLNGERVMDVNEHVILKSGAVLKIGQFLACKIIIK